MHSHPSGGDAPAREGVHIGAPFHISIHTRTRIHPHFSFAIASSSSSSSVQFDPISSHPIPLRLDSHANSIVFGAASY